MKLKFTYTFLLALLVSTFFTSSRGGRNTFESCSQAGCHSASSNSKVDSVSLIEASSGNVVTEYKPNTIYTIKFYGSNSMSLSKFGFQVSHNNKGTFSSPAVNSKLSSVSLWEHSTVNSGVGTYTSEAKWTSPNSGAGGVTFSSYLNAVNDDGNTSGDAVSSLYTRTYGEATISSVTASVSISITSGSNPSQSGADVTFTANPTNGGSNPSYQWKVDGNNKGSNSNTYTTNSLTDGQVVTCEMTSNLNGVQGSPATSNLITMSIQSSSSISKQVIREIDLVPLEAKNSFRLIAPKNNLQLFVHDLSGKTVFNQNLNGHERIDLSNINTGVYIVNIMDMNSNRLYHKTISFE